MLDSGIITKMQATNQASQILNCLAQKAQEQGAIITSMRADMPEFNMLYDHQGTDLELRISFDGFIPEVFSMMQNYNQQMVIGGPQIPSSIGLKLDPKTGNSDDDKLDSRLDSFAGVD